MLGAILADVEEAMHQLVRRKLKEIAGLAARFTPEPPKIYVPRIDRARVVAVFLDDNPPAAHIVWDDEIVPHAAIDREYRRHRCAKYGRTADVETVIFQSSSVAYLYTTWAMLQPYETSVHGTIYAPYAKAVFSWTWNHLMDVVPSPWVTLRGGYYLARGYEVRRGSREEAEDYAKSLGCKLD